VGRLVGPSPSQTFNALTQGAAFVGAERRSRDVVRRASEILANGLLIDGINLDADGRLVRYITNPL